MSACLHQSRAIDHHRLSPRLDTIDDETPPLQSSEVKPRLDLGLIERDKARVRLFEKKKIKHGLGKT
jgi:hypothetical protein